MLQPTDFHYLGWFFDPDALYSLVSPLTSGHLYRKINHPHITAIYRPTQSLDHLFGIPAQVTITGYGNNGENEGVFVQLSTENPELQALFDQIPCPHITLSVSEIGRPVDTKFLHFTPVPPTTIQALFGGFLLDGCVIAD